MDEVVAPLLHNNVPVKAEAVNNEFPQLFDTVIVGATGTAFGAATPLPAGLVQPLAVLVTVYVAALVTVIEELVDPVLHNKVVPETVVVDNTELPQLFVTVTTGVAGVVLGAEVALAEEVH